ncbi:hypothetical protein B0J13DRAFT_576301 [Dactylonectria estremocensis]|uniref:Uncharacterized protein n=1 Tax=Dactylonectria estremocensis TaxID=1079267 RepID=A0A9P9D3H4_9HYPO|nr:hypothetical protein B0J13DRAFT_576301 [Dactylonectria estremocensis]
MRFNTLSGLTWLLLAGLGLTDAFETCSTTEAAACSCPASVAKRYQARAHTFPEHLFPRVDVLCSDGTPPCCVKRGPGPLQVSADTSKTDLQCGTKFGDDQQDVTNGVAYTIEDCPATGPYSGQKCLHIAITTAAGVTLTDIHLQVDDKPITLNTKLGTWAFNKYCTASPSECWVPVSAIIATFDPPVTSLCATTIYVAAGISISIPGSTSGATCFNKGTTIGSGNWFMYFPLKLECPEICLSQCCCPSTQPPSTKLCPIGTAMGYGDGAINLNGDPVPPALSGQGCNRWGWYFTPNQAALSGGIDGTLIVGAGGNVVSAGTPVGIWSATLLFGNVLQFTYQLYDDDTNGHFDLAEVHVYAACVEPSKCAPGQYTFVQESLTGNSDTLFVGSIPVGSCSTYYLIFHAKVNQQFPSSEACPPETP